MPGQNEENKQQAKPAAPKPTPPQSGGGGGKPEVKLESAVKPKDKKGKDAPKKASEEKKKKPSVLDQTAKGGSSYMQEMMELLKMGQELANELEAFGKELPGAIANAPGAIKNKIKDLTTKVENFVDRAKELFSQGSPDDNKSSQQNKSNPTMTSLPDSPSPEGTALNNDDTAGFNNKVGAGKKVPDGGGVQPDADEDEEQNNRIEL